MKHHESYSGITGAVFSERLTLKFVNYIQGESRETDVFKEDKTLRIF